MDIVVGFRIELLLRVAKIFAGVKNLLHVFVGIM